MQARSSPQTLIAVNCAIDGFLPLLARVISSFPFPPPPRVGWAGKSVGTTDYLLLDLFSLRRNVGVFCLG
uniref:Uncharacterized protein n=1 Tax=Oryza rufipogon TaxID=4529 RepID=A0A0E0R3Y6_ORYRU